MSRKTRKLIWSAPLMAVLAVAGALALFVALSPNETMAQSAEVDYAAGSPLNVTVEPGAGEAKRTSLVIKWAVPTTGSDLPITGYRIDQSTDGQRWTHLADVSATARSSHGHRPQAGHAPVLPGLCPQPGWYRPGVRGQVGNDRGHHRAQ